MGVILSTKCCFTAFKPALRRGNAQVSSVSPGANSRSKFGFSRPDSGYQASYQVSHSISIIHSQWGINVLKKKYCICIQFCRFVFSFSVFYHPLIKRLNRDVVFCSRNWILIFEMLWMSPCAFIFFSYLVSELWSSKMSCWTAL